MRRTALPLLALLSALALAPAARAQAPAPLRIAPGVSAAGTDVGGLTLEEAAARLYAAGGPVLGRPIAVEAAGKHYGLRVNQVGLAFDVNKSARRAYNAGLAAGGKPVDVPLYVTYGADKVKAFVAEAARGLRVAPRNATVRISLRHLRKVPGRRGRSVDATALARAVRTALVDPRAPRVIAPALRTVKPDVTTGALARAYPTVLTIDQSSFTLRLFKRLKWVKSYRVAVGQPAYPTPNGLFKVLDKQVNPVWSVPNSPWAGELGGTTVQGGTAENPLKARWMGLGGGVGIHGTGEDYSIGSRASHGCIRMHVSDVIALFNRVPVGTPVRIAP